MIAALICIISFAAFLQFFVWYCRSLLAMSLKSELSKAVCDVTGAKRRKVGAGDFERIVELVGLCPERGDDRTEIRVVGTYYGLLDILSHMARTVVPPLADWIEHERERCSYFAAVMLDRRISHNFDLFTQQVSETL
jgi:hypothetical protein